VTCQTELSRFLKFEDGGWFDPEYLDSMRGYAQKLTLREDDAQEITLKLIVPDR